MSFKTRIRKVRDVPLIEVHGDLTGPNVGKVAIKLETLRKTNSRAIAIDLSKTTFIDSHGLGAFVYCWRLLENQNRQLIFLNPQGFIMNMLQNTNLDRVFKVVTSEEDL